MEMFVLRRRAIGQFVLAAIAASINRAWVASGTLARTSNCIRVIVQPAAKSSSVAVAIVSILSGWKPLSPSSRERAMLKQPLSEAAISSSGLVPMPSANSVAWEYWVLKRTPLSVVRVPSPPCRVPFQVAEAFLFIMRADQDWGARQAKYGHCGKRANIFLAARDT
jgi:hypothetical protein